MPSALLMGVTMTTAAAGLPPDWLMFEEAAEFRATITQGGVANTLTLINVFPSRVFCKQSIFTR